MINAAADFFYVLRFFSGVCSVDFSPLMYLRTLIRSFFLVLFPYLII